MLLTLLFYRTYNPKCQIVGLGTAKICKKQQLIYWESRLV